MPAIGLVIRAGWLMAWAVTSACQPQTVAETEQSPNAVTVAAADFVTAAQTVITFLSWYKNHMQAANQIVLVNQQAGNLYSVNLKNGERYLAYLKGSRRLTDTYLNGWRMFLKERQEGFRPSPQTEGPPTRLDYDLVMLNQDLGMQLASLKFLIIKQIDIKKGHTGVTFVLLDTYKFRLVKQAGRWLIDEIFNLTEE